MGEDFSFADSNCMGMNEEIREALAASLSNITMPQIKMPDLSIPEIRNFNYADYTYEVIMERIKEFEDSLDDDHEIAIRLASFGQSITMSVTEIGYSNPSTLVFYGLIGDQRATLIQHVSQLNFLLLSVKKEDPEKPPRRIGFDLPSAD